ncbi:MAG: alpha/beta hydrolase [Clostridia bacterium]|nr:alpha/beta hydrolase [Clostridia bacterium]
MKRFTAVFLASLLTALCFIMPVAADTPAKNLPAVVVTGFSSDQLYINYGGEDQEKVWSFPIQAVLTQTLSDLPNFMFSLFMLFLGNFEKMGVTVADGGKTILKKMYCNPDGSSVYPIETYPNDPALCNYEYMLNNTNGEDIHETPIVEALAEQTGPEDVFIFQYDTRMGAVDIAAQLNDFIKDVLEYTGEDRVNMFGLSYGGLIVGAYLSLYGTQGDVHNAVMSVPALAGTSFASRFFKGEVDVPFYDLICFAETAINMETDIAPIIKNINPKNLEKLAGAFLREIREIPLYWGSMWDLLTVEDYDALKNEYLDSEESAELIRKSDIMHYEIMPQYRTNFLKAKQAGTNISILCNYGTTTAFGGDRLGDVLLDAEKVTGATCAKFGERFADGYEPVCTVCADPSHNHVSPSLEIDASSAYLPENTWFFNNQFHGMYSFDNSSFSLVKKLMSADDETDIHSSRDYPQFIDSDNRYLAVKAQFDSSNPGYLSDNDTSLIISNVSDDRNVMITGVKADGADLEFTLPKKKILAPGETMTVTFSGDIPKVSRQYFTLTVSYIRPSLGRDFDSRVMDFSIVNA